MGRSRTIALSILAIALPSAGCGKDDAPTQVVFPDVNTLPKPIAPSNAKPKVDSQNTSQGDPSQYTQ